MTCIHRIAAVLFLGLAPGILVAQAAPSVDLNFEAETLPSEPLSVETVPEATAEPRPATAGPSDLTLQTLRDRQVQVSLRDGSQLNGTLLGYDDLSLVLSMQDRVLEVRRAQVSDLRALDSVTPSTTTPSTTSTMAPTTTSSASETSMRPTNINDVPLSDGLGIVVGLPFVSIGFDLRLDSFMLGAQLGFMTALLFGALEQLVLPLSLIAGGSYAQNNSNMRFEVFGIFAAIPTNDPWSGNVAADFGLGLGLGLSFEYEGGFYWGFRLPVIGFGISTGEFGGIGDLFGGLGGQPNLAQNMLGFYLVGGASMQFFYVGYRFGA